MAIINPVLAGVANASSVATAGGGGFGGLSGTPAGFGGMGFQGVGGIGGNAQSNSDATSFFASASIPIVGLTAGMAEAEVPARLAVTPIPWPLEMDLPVSST